MPERIQQRRTRGWRKPENTVSVARPSKWGNPYRAGEPSGWEDGDGPILLDRTAAVVLFKQIVEGDGIWDDTRGKHLDEAAIRAELGGKNLMCFCPLDQPCHADVLLEIANGEGSGS